MAIALFNGIQELYFKFYPVDGRDLKYLPHDRATQLFGIVTPFILGAFMIILTPNVLFIDQIRCWPMETFYPIYTSYAEKVIKIF